MFDLTPFERKNNRRMSAYNPFHELEEFEKELFGRSVFPEFKTDIKDVGEAFELEADLPGFKKEDIHIDIDGDSLVITAERKSETEEEDKKKNYVRRERSYGSFARSFDISSISASDISAEYKDGVLKLTLPKKQNEVPSSRRLEIK